jgi:hypothetical protein
MAETPAFLTGSWFVQSIQAKAGIVPRLGQALPFQTVTISSTISLFEAV